MIHAKPTRKKILLGLGIALVTLLVALPLLIYTVNALKPTIPPEEKYYPLDNQSSYVPDELIVKFREGYEPELVNQLVAEREVYSTDRLGQIIITRQNAEYALTAQKTPEEKKAIIDQMTTELQIIGIRKVSVTDDPVMSRYYVLIFPEGTDLEKKQQQLSQYEAIDFLEPDYIAELFQTVTPNDPQFPVMWGLEMIEAPVAWQTSKGSKSVTVAVADTGVDRNHTDLSANVIAGTNIINGGNNSQDDHFHGTHVSGTIGAVTNNGTGVAGINWNVNILPVKVCNSEGRCPSSAVAAGISYAAQSGARVINLSVGGTPNCSQQRVYQDAVNEALSRNMVVVVASGNSNVDASSIAPASCQGVIAVGAVGTNGSRAAYSNYGSVLTIAAPGGNSGDTGRTPQGGIISTVPGNQYAAISGTSMAAPHVAGAAALLLSLKSNLTPQQVKNCLVNGATPLTSDRNIGPLLNLPGAIEACNLDQNPTQPPPSPSPTTTQPSPTGQQASPSPSLSPSPNQDNYSVSGITFYDQNKNLTRDNGEPPVQGVRLTLTNPSVNLTATSNTSGGFLFPNLQQGTYTLSQSYNNIDMWSFNQFPVDNQMPHVYFMIPIDRIIPTQSPTPIPTNAPTGGSAFPSPIDGQPIVPTISITPTITPTPFVFFDCKPVRETRTVNGKPIAISRLECTRID